MKNCVSGFFVSGDEKYEQGIRLFFRSPVEYVFRIFLAGVINIMKNINEKMIFQEFQSRRMAD